MNPLYDNFMNWYKGFDMSPDPFDPLHYYDYVSAFLNSVNSKKGEHLPSSFKLPNHPNRYPEEMSRFGRYDSLTDMYYPTLGMSERFMEKTNMDRYNLMKLIMQALGEQR